jgi:hypothetical protein
MKKLMKILVGFDIKAGLYKINDLKNHTLLFTEPNNEDELEFNSIEFSISMDRIFSFASSWEAEQFEWTACYLDNYHFNEINKNHGISEFRKIIKQKTLDKIKVIKNQFKIGDSLNGKKIIGFLNELNNDCYAYLE